VYVTAGIVRSLRAEELDAVLWHEDRHAVRRDPLRRALMQAGEEVLFYMPLVRWWSGQQRERAELAADKTAITRVGRAPVAAALMAAAAAQTSPAVGFDGAAQARVAQLLGDELPRRSPSPEMWVTSLSGLTLVVVLVMCVGQTMEYLLLG
jgi:beta-lactamase regulating signal transducer with metallopeptidase domain